MPEYVNLPASPEIASLYGSLRKDFNAAVQNYNGSRKAEKQLLDKGSVLEKVVTEFAAASGQDVTTAERILAQQAGIDLGLNYYEALQHGIDHLGEVLNASYRTSFKELLATLREKGVVINEPRAELIRPQEGQPLQAGSGTGHEVKFEPRLTWVIDLLMKSGIHTDEFYLDPGLPEPSRMRQEPYVLINLPGYGEAGLQIAVCNQVGEATFLSNVMYDPDFYARHTKEQLEGFELQRIEHRNHAAWEKSIRDFIKRSEDETPHTTPEIRAASRKPRPGEFRPTAAQILDKVIATMMAESDAAKRKFVTVKDKGAVPGWEGWDWVRVNDYTANHLDVRLPDLIRQEVCAQAKAWLENNPDATEAELMKAPLPGFAEGWAPDMPGVTFRDVDLAFKNGNGHAKSSLVAVLDKGRVLEGTKIKAQRMDRGTIFRLVMAQMMAEPEPGKRKLVTVNDKGAVPGWEGWDWVRVNDYTANHLDVRLPDLIRQEVCAQAKAWLENNPDATEAELMKAPLPGFAEGWAPDMPGVTFRDVDLAFKNGNGHAKSSLVAVLDKGRVLEGTKIKAQRMDRGTIFRLVMAEMMAESDPAKRKFVTVKDKGAIPGWEGWDWQRVNTHAARNLDNVTSLSDLIRQEICAQVKAWLENNPEATEKELLDAQLSDFKDGWAPDMPGVTFRDIDLAFKNGNRQAKTSLLKVLDEGGALEGTKITARRMDRGTTFRLVMADMMTRPASARKFVTSNDKSAVLGWEGWNWVRVSKHTTRHLGVKGLADLIRQEICAQATAWLENNPEATEKELLDAQLSDFKDGWAPDMPGVTFRDIDLAFNNGNGQSKTSLLEVLDEGGALEGTNIQGRRVDVMAAQIQQPEPPGAHL